MSSENTKIATPKIAMRGVEKSFGPKQILRGVDLSVDPGKSLVIIGGSGTGKSVMLKCILGLLKPEKGVIEIDGQDVLAMSKTEHAKVLRKVGMLFQSAALFDSLSVWENVAFGLMQNDKISRKDAKDAAVEKLGLVGLSADIADLSPDELSGGMRKRVGLARAIAYSPEIIFFDEPTTGLDPIMSDVINDLIASSVKKVGATALTITHDMSSARKIADHVAMIYKGEIIWHGPIEDMDHCGNPYVEQFIRGSADGPIQMEVLKP